MGSALPTGSNPASEESATESNSAQLSPLYGWYALNVLGFPPHVIALHLGHDDGGELVRNLYAHPDAAIARDMTRERFANVVRVQSLRPVATQRR